METDRFPGVEKRNDLGGEVQLALGSEENGK
jgi:hypothetical protein